MTKAGLLIMIFQVTIIAAIGCYFYQTQTRIRNTDLEAIMKQNNSITRGIETTRKNSQKELREFDKIVKISGNSPKDVQMLKQVKTIKNYSDSIFITMDTVTALPKNLKINDLTSLAGRNVEILNEYNTNFPKFIATQDTSLKVLENDIRPFLYSKNNYFPLVQKNMLSLRYRFTRLENMGIDGVVGRVTYCGNIRFDRIVGMAAAKSQLVEEGKTYEALMFIGGSDYAVTTKMQISEGTLNVQGGVGEITLWNVSAKNFDNEGKAMKVLTGKIKVINPDGIDTTYTVSTIYTIKKK
jgi:hypothetical protein